jgi:hypothetical protein
VGWVGAEFGGEGCLGFEDDVIGVVLCVQGCCFRDRPPRDGLRCFWFFIYLLGLFIFGNWGASRLEVFSLHSIRHTYIPTAFIFIYKFYC